MILIAGMGNVKQGNWQGILVYFLTKILLGAALAYGERKLIEPVYQLPQTGCTFSVLLYVAFTIFWNGTSLLGLDNKNSLFDEQNEISSENRLATNQNNLHEQKGGRNQ